MERFSRYRHSAFAGGILCLFLPAISDFAASTMFGLVLMAIGVVKIIQSLWIKSWAGFVWQELSGVVELIGGIMIYLNPLKGARSPSPC